MTAVNYPTVCRHGVPAVVVREASFFQGGEKVKVLASRSCTQCPQDEVVWLGHLTKDEPVAWQELGKTAGPVVVTPEGEPSGEVLGAPDMEVVHKTTRCLDKARALVCGDRAEQYGDPRATYGGLAKAWQGYREILDANEREITARDCVNLMGILKFFRDAQVQKADNLVDAAGYAQLGAWCGPPEGPAPKFDLSFTSPLTEGEINAVLGADDPPADDAGLEYMGIP